MITTLQFANELILREPWLSHLKIQRLTYCAYGWFFVVFKNKGPLFDEGPEAWKYAPMFPKLYYQLTDRELESESPFFALPVRDVDAKDAPAPRLCRDKQKKLIEFADWVSKRYRPYTGIQLSNGWIKKEGSAYAKARASAPNSKPVPMSDEDIIAEFTWLKGG